VLLGIASATAVAALQKETRTIPILFVNVADPVGSGLVTSLPRPSGNVTGFTNFEYSISGKWLDLLKKIVPRLARAALLFNPDTAPHGFAYVRWLEIAAGSFNLMPMTMAVRDVAEIERAVATLGQETGGALIVVNDSFLVLHRKNLIASAAQHQLPAIYPNRFFALDGGLISYGPELVDSYRSAASYVDRILRGEKVRDLPVQQPTKFELTINMKTARALGLTIPETLLATADEVIE
jgi:putative tryptophan/tyrosine transport system substrate-binding protein